MCVEEDRDMTYEKQRILTEYGQFRHDFWAFYVDRHTGDRITLGYAGYSPDYHVEGTKFRIRRYLTRKYVALWVTAERQTVESVPELVRPYLPALARNLGKVPEDLFNGDPGHLPRYAYTHLLINTNNRENWPQAIDWLHESLDIYLNVLTERFPIQA